MGVKIPDINLDGWKIPEFKNGILLSDILSTLTLQEVKNINQRPYSKAQEI
mgnify:CR=1 FL=1